MEYSTDTTNLDDEYLVGNFENIDEHLVGNFENTDDEYWVEGLENVDEEYTRLKTKIIVENSDLGKDEVETMLGLLHANPRELHPETESDYTTINALCRSLDRLDQDTEISVESDYIEQELEKIT
jgi:hypothetical protein